MHIKLHQLALVSLSGLLVAVSVMVPAVAQEQDKPAKVVDGTENGVRMEFLSLRRSEGGMLTLRVAFVNDSGGQVQNAMLPGTGNVENFGLIDYANHRRYLVARDSGGACLCTSLNPFKATEPGRRVLWAKFSAPPESVDHVALLMPEAEPIDGVPITHRGISRCFAVW